MVLLEKNKQMPNAQNQEALHVINLQFSRCKRLRFLNKYVERAIISQTLYTRQRCTRIRLDKDVKTKDKHFFS